MSIYTLTPWYISNISTPPLNEIFDTTYSSDEADGNDQSSVEDVTSRTHIISHNEVPSKVVVSNRSESSHRKNVNACNDHNIIIISIKYSDKIFDQ